MRYLLLGIASGGVLPALAQEPQCGTAPSAEAQIACYVRAYCPNASSSTEQAACYEKIIRSLLPPPQEVPPQEVPVVAQEQLPTNWPESVPAEPAPVIAERAPVVVTAAPPTAPAPAKSAVIDTPPAREAATLAAAEPQRKSWLQRIWSGGDAPSEPQRNVTEATIVVAKEVSFGAYIIRLNNGEVWEEIERSHNRFRTGDTIKITPAAFGSHVLRQASGGDLSNVRRLDCGSSAARIDRATRQKCAYVNASANASASASSDDR